MRSRTPLPLWILAGVGVVFVSLPLLALVLRAPWDDIGASLSGAGAAEALRLSIVVSLAATGLSLLLGVPLAWVLARSHMPGRAVLRAIVVLPVVLPPVVGGIGLLAALGRGGVIGRWLLHDRGPAAHVHDVGGHRRHHLRLDAARRARDRSGSAVDRSSLRAGGGGARCAPPLRDPTCRAADARARNSWPGRCWHGRGRSASSARRSRSRATSPGAPRRCRSPCTRPG